MAHPMFYVLHLKKLTGSCKWNLQPWNEQITNTLSVAMDISKLCIAVCFLYAICLFSLSQPSLWSGHTLHLRKLPRFKSFSVIVVLKSFSLLTHGRWGSDPRLADSVAVTLTFLASLLSFPLLSSPHLVPLLYYPLRSPFLSFIFHYKP